MICKCTGHYRVTNVISMPDATKRRLSCEKCGRISYSIEQLYADDIPKRPALRVAKKKAIYSTRAARSILDH